MRYAQALKSVGDAEVVDALLPVLLQTLDDDVGRLDAAFEVRQLAAARAVLHGLKGVLPMFCSEELARQIVELEVLSKAGEVQAACTQWPAPTTGACSTAAGKSARMRSWCRSRT